MSEKVRENKLRRRAKRRGYRLVKSRRRDERAYDYGLYGLLDLDGTSAIGNAVDGSPYVATLDDIETDPLIE